jgi:thioredoxin 1
MIAPHFESLATKYSKPGKITFVKVDVDKQQSIASAHSVRAMPTFLIFKSGSLLETVQGANPSGLTAAVEKAVKLAGTAAPGASFKTPGRTLGAASGSGPTAARPAWGSASGFSINRFLNTLIAFIGMWALTLFSVGEAILQRCRCQLTHHSSIRTRPLRTPTSIYTSHKQDQSLYL